MEASDIKGPLRIIRLTASNVKRLVAVDITPDGNVVQITGRNESGKSSILDCIPWALAGKEAIQDVPIRRGESEAHIRLDLGEVIVTRKFKKKDSGEITTAVVVEAADGSRFTSPQELLNSFLGALCFDPLAFARMKPEQQMETLRQFVPGVDFAGIDAANKLDFDKRHDINRRHKEAAAAEAGIKLASNPPCQAVDESALTAALQSAGTANTERATRQANRERAIERIATLRGLAAGVDGRIAAAEDRRTGAYNDAQSAAAEQVASLERQIADLRQELGRVVDRMTAAATDLQVSLAADSQRLTAEAATQQAEADALQAKLDAAGELPAVVDTDALLTQIDAARASNQRLAEWTADNRRREELRAVAKQLKAESDALTTAMDARDKSKRDAIKGAKMPVANLDFGINSILLDGLPFAQASSARRTRTSVAIAMAGNPKLRVCRIQDGSLLDDDGMAIIAEMAQEHGFQVWVERVDSSGRVGFVIEDGRQKSEEAAAK